MKSNDKNFIQRLKRQKEDALEYIVDTYLPLIKGVTYKVLSPLENEGVIEECMNDILLSICNNSNKFHGDSTDFRKWICAIAKFKSIDYYRKNSKRVEFTTNEMELSCEKSAEEELIMLEDKTGINSINPFIRACGSGYFYNEIFSWIKNRGYFSKTRFNESVHR